MKLIRLFIIRVLLIVVLSVAEFVTLFVKKIYHYPLMWLNHYLIGSGKDKMVPEHLIIEARSAIERTVEMGKDRKTYPCFYYNYGSYCLDSSTLYDGSGFYARPSLFYLVGGFSFNINENGDLYATDYYDWHATDNGNYFTSPIGSGKLSIIIVKALGFIFGQEYFVLDAWPCHNNGISNKLWEDLQLVGAKPFMTKLFAPHIVESTKECAINNRGLNVFESRQELNNFCSAYGFPWVTAENFYNGLYFEYYEIQDQVSPEPGNWHIEGYYTEYNIHGLGYVAQDGETDYLHDMRVEQYREFHYL